jgi:hypothetical protein
MTAILATENETFNLHGPESNERNSIDTNHDGYYNDMIKTIDVEGFWLPFWVAKALETGESYGPEHISPAYAKKIFFDDPAWTVKLAEKSETSSRK